MSTDHPRTTGATRAAGTAGAAREPHLVELGQFLKARRAERSPQQLGLAPRDLRAGGARRVSGLRREEVAVQVAVSTDYYTRVEQGRLCPSEAVLAAIADVLGLNAQQRDFAEGLAARARRGGGPARRTGRTAHGSSAPVRAQVRRLLEQINDDTPALVVGKYQDVLAWNALVAELLIDFATVPARERNYVRLLFTDARFKDIYGPEWETHARTSVAQLRMAAVDNPHDPRLTALVGELSLTQPLFRTWWADHHVARPEFGQKTLHHPVVGAVTVSWDSFTWNGDPDQHLTMWSTQPGSSSQEKLRILASWMTSPSRRPGAASDDEAVPAPPGLT